MEGERKIINSVEKSIVDSEATRESIETLRQLREFLAEGYVFHGSKKKSSILEPRQANDTDESRIIGRQNAIYATDKHLEIPLFMAMKDRKDPSNISIKSGYHGYGDQFYMYGENATLTPGYVYVLPRDTFEVISDEEGNDELISREPVMPYAVFKVRPDIFKLFPNVTLDLK